MAQPSLYKPSDFPNLKASQETFIRRELFKIAKVIEEINQRLKLLEEEVYGP